MITKKDLLDWLKRVDKKIDRPMILIAVGGTAMTLIGLKPSTRDIDFCVESKDFRILKELTQGDKFKVDIYRDGFIFSEQLPEDYIKKSAKVESGLVNIGLRTLSLIDIIITKTARYNERDEEDIAAIAETKQVKKEELKKRFEKIRKTFAGRDEDYLYHFNLVLKRHFEK